MVSLYFGVSGWSGKTVKRSSTLMRSWIEADKLRVLIDKVYPLTQIGEAFEK